MKQENSRKIWGVYVTFRELGKARLSQTKFWLPMACLRTTLCKETLHGLTSVVRLLLRSLFLGPEGWGTAGVLVDLDEPRILFTVLGNLLGDEAALNRVCSSKGAGGIVPCVICKNVVALNEDSLVDHSSDGYIVDISCGDNTKFDHVSDKELYDKHDMLNELSSTATPGEFKQIEQAMGIAFNPVGVLSDRELRPHVRLASVWTYDPMHICFANGICHFEMTTFLHCLRQHSVHFSSISQLMKGWAWAKCRQKRANEQLARAVFSPSREKSFLNTTFKATGSEILMVYPILRWLCTETLEAEAIASEEVKSFISMTRVLDGVRPGAPSRCDLDACVSQHIANFVAAYGKHSCKPKHHSGCHMAAQLARDTMLIDTWAPERFHKLTKTVAEDIVNTGSFKTSVITRLVGCVIADLQEPSSACFVGKPQELPEYEAGAAFARGFRASFPF
jgi:hypothetical protein